MASAEMIRPYVEKLLKEWLGTDELIVDDDGDVPIRAGSSKYYVSILDRDPPLVRVWGTVLTGVKKSAKLLDAINDANTRILQCRMFFHDGDVMLASEILGEEIDKEELIEACNAVAQISDDFDDTLQAEFGGQKVFDDQGDTPPGEETVDV
jgi:hypothetical protein